MTDPTNTGKPSLFVQDARTKRRKAPERVFNWDLILGPDTSESRPEAAGIGVSMLGSLFMMLVVLGLSLPIGVAAAIYLEEFASKNRYTDLVEVNISNLAAVPSIREAALGVGASKMQTVMHHVLPLAMPGILTGVIVGMAQAPGETAPLLLIGMVGFIDGFLAPNSAMPAQIYEWSKRADPACYERAWGGIIILLIFLSAMNILAVILRRRFERRW